MKLQTKASILSVLIFFVIYLIVWCLIYFIFDKVSILIISAITAGIATILSPREQIIQTQSGPKIQFKWLFFKKVITIK